MLNPFPPRKRLRLPGYDYTLPGHYAITMCTFHREYYFGDVENYEMKLSAVGKLAQTELLRLPERYGHVEVDAFIVMPNHIHAILGMGGATDLVQVVAGFKNRVAYFARRDHKVDRLWQRRFFDHVVRHQDSLEQHREYVLANPIQWDLDELNKANWNAFVDSNPNLHWRAKCSNETRQ